MEQTSPRYHRQCIADYCPQFYLVNFVLRFQKNRLEIGIDFVHLNQLWISWCDLEFAASCFAGNS